MWFTQQQRRCKLITYKNKNKMKTRFPFALKPQDAQRIIEAACISWKHALASGWSKDIVLDNTISISEDFYKEMRAACTAVQHTLFDEIFGHDIDFSILNDTDVFYIKSRIGGEGLFKGSKPFEQNTYCYSITMGAKNERKARICKKEDVIQLRLANEEELKIWEEQYPSQKVKVGDCVITFNYWDEYNGRVLKVIEIKDKKYAYFTVFDGGFYNEHSNFNIECTVLRLATQEEIDTARCPYKDGELIFVRQLGGSNWYLRYSAGKITNENEACCYPLQEKSGGIELWGCHAPTPKGFKLPE